MEMSRLKPETLVHPTGILEIQEGESRDAHLKAMQRSTNKVDAVQPSPRGRESVNTRASISC